MAAFGRVANSVQAVRGEGSKSQQVQVSKMLCKSVSKVLEVV